MAACSDCAWFSADGGAALAAREHVMSGGAHTVRTVRVTQVMEEIRYVIGETPDNVVHLPLLD